MYSKLFFWNRHKRDVHVGATAAAVVLAARPVARNFLRGCTPAERMSHPENSFFQSVPPSGHFFLEEECTSILCTPPGGGRIFSAVNVRKCKTLRLDESYRLVTTALDLTSHCGKIHNVFITTIAAGYLFVSPRRDSGQFSIAMDIYEI